MNVAVQVKQDSLTALTEGMPVYFVKVRGWWCITVHTAIWNAWIRHEMVIIMLCWILKQYCCDCTYIIAYVYLQIWFQFHRYSVHGNCGHGSSKGSTHPWVCCQSYLPGAPTASHGGSDLSVERLHP